MNNHLSDIPHRIFFLGLFCLFFAGSAAGAGAAVELEHSFQGEVAGAAPEDLIGLVFDEKGRLYAVDGRSRALLRIENGTAGRVVEDVAAGFAEPAEVELTGLAMVDHNTVAVADRDGGSIGFIGLDGRLESRFGEKGGDAGMLDEPRDVAYSINQRLYIADEDADRVSIFSHSGVFLFALGGAEMDRALRLDDPAFVGVDRGERIYGLKPGRSAALSIYESAGRLLTSFPNDQLENIVGQNADVTAMAVDAAGRLFLADSAQGKIVQLDPSEGAVVTSFGSQGEGPGQFREVTRMAVSSDNRLAVLDRHNNKLDIYRLGGDRPAAKERAWLANIGRVEFLPTRCSTAYRLHDLNVLCLDEDADTVSIISPEGETVHELKGDFSNPRRAAFDHEHIAVLDRDRVFVFNRDGTAVTRFGGSGSDEGELSDPTDLYLHDNRIFVAEKRADRIQIFSLKGVYLDRLPKMRGRDSPLEEPAALAVDSNGNVYVADNRKHKILVFDDTKERLYDIGRLESAPDAFEEIFDLALDTDNNLYVLAETGLKEQTVQVYSGPDKVFEFGAHSEDDATGIGEGLTISVSPTSQTIISVFDTGYAGGAGLVAFNYLQVPAPVVGLEVAGGRDATELTWQRPPGAYTEKYKVYSAPSPDGPFEYRLTADAPSARIEHQQADGPAYVKVSAVSGFGTEGPMSSARENRFLTAHKAFTSGDYEQAIAVLQEDLQRNPDQPAATRLLGLALQRLDRHGEAADIYRQLREIDGYATEGLNRQVQALYEAQRFTQAMELARQAVKENPENVQSYINCGRLSLKIGDAVGAVVCLEDGLKRARDSAEIHFLLAEAHIALGGTEQGVSHLEKAIATRADNADLWVRGGDIYRSLEQYQQAEKQYNKALALEADHTGAQLGLARTYMALGQKADARTVAIKLAGKSESAATGNYLLGLMALEDGQLGQAALSLSKATRDEPANMDAWLALAEAYRAQDQLDKAEASLRSAVEVDPNAFAALKQLGLLLFKKEAYTEAADTLLQAARLNGDDYQVAFAAAQSLFNDNQYLRAAEFSRKAVELSEGKTEALQLAAQVARQRGKIGEAIEHLKSAIEKESGSYTLHVQLGELYLENNLYDKAQPVLERATVIDKSGDESYRLLGDMFMQRRLFDKAIAAYEKAVELNATSDNRLALDTAYAEKKRSLEFSNNAPQLVLEDLQLDPVFSAAYKQYNDKPVGSVKVRNVSGVKYGNLKVSFQIKGYMDFPTSKEIKELEPNSSRQVQLSAAFNNRILEIDEDTGVQVEVKLSYVREGRNDHVSVTRPMTIYGKNAIVWADPRMVGSFVTPKDDALRDFVRQAVNENKPKAGPLSENLVAAMTLFNVFSEHGIRYEVDPNNPFSSLKADQVDYVQFGRETLRLKSGDCDDLSVLFSAGLENLGIPTAILDVPGHLLLMFNTNVPAEDRALISGQDDLLVVHDGKVWVPLEVTMIGTSFAEAWAEGARKYHEYREKDQLEAIHLKQAWERYQPVTLKPAGYQLEPPAPEQLATVIHRDRVRLLQKSLDRVVAPYEAILAADPANTTARMQIAIIYAKNGLYSLAHEALDGIAAQDANNSAVYNNRGNIYFQQGDWLRAREAYQQAERLDPSDGGIKINLALVAYQQGKLSLARDKYKQALRLNQSLEEEYATLDKLLKS